MLGMLTDDKRKMAQAIVAKIKPSEPESEPEPTSKDAAHAAAQGLIDAVTSGNAQGVVEAFRALMDCAGEAGPEEQDTSTEYPVG